MKPSDKYRDNAVFRMSDGDVILTKEMFETMLDELDDKLKDKPEKPSFDWSQCPKDTVFEVWQSGIIGGIHVLKHFSHVGKGGQLRFFPDGQSSNTYDIDISLAIWENFRLAHNPPCAWFGGPQPVPDETRVKYLMRCKPITEWIIGQAGDLQWLYEEDEPDGGDIIAYEILGEDHE